MRDFPFDLQTFRWNLRSTTYPRAVMQFTTANATAASAASALLDGLVDPTFVFSSYQQASFTVASGVFTDYDLLSISVLGQRIATMSSIFLIFPLCIVCASLCLVLHRQPSNDARLSVPTTLISATMAFSFVISNQCPPVSYTTRIHLLIFQTYIFATAALAVNYYLWSIEFCRKELSGNNDRNKALLNDAHWVPRKIKPTTTNVVVLPEGIHKPPDPPAATDAPGSLPPKVASDAPEQVQSLSHAEPIHVFDFMAPEPQPEPPKSSKSGSFPDKDGAFKDVTDLLDSDEVRVFKVQRWGGAPVLIWWGLVEVNNGNTADWAEHVKLVDRILNAAFPVLCVISVGCILGVQNLVGLGSAPMMSLGIPRWA